MKLTFQSLLVASICAFGLFSLDGLDYVSVRTAEELGALGFTWFWLVLCCSIGARRIYWTGLNENSRVRLGRWLLLASASVLTLGVAIFYLVGIRALGLGVESWRAAGPLGVLSLRLLGYATFPIATAAAPTGIYLLHLATRKVVGHL